MSEVPRFLKANEQYAASFTKGELKMPPARRVAVVACMDARLDPARVLGLEEGDAHVIRNAGGRAADAVRSLVISQQLLGTREVVVIHHTDCGMLTFTDGSSAEAAQRAGRRERHRIPVVHGPRPEHPRRRRGDPGVPLPAQGRSGHRLRLRREDGTTAAGGLAAPGPGPGAKLD
jgi:carbonic anhydrase